MACIASAKPTCSLVAPRSVAPTGLRPLPAAFSKVNVAQRFAAAPRSAKVERRNTTAVQAVGAVEIAQIAGEFDFIAGVAGVMVGITLIGLAFGFIILRVESLVEEGKI